MIIKQPVLIKNKVGDVRMERFIITDLEDATNVKHCTGCFGCFFKDPGRCIIMDECQNQGQKIGHCQEIILISKLTFGGYSRIAKKRFDRSLPYIHGDFHIFHGQMHHKGRYENDPILKVYFYGTASDREKETARILVERNSYNLALNKYEVYFCDTAEQAMKSASVTLEKDGKWKAENVNNHGCSVSSIQADKADEKILKIALLNGSPRGAKGASGSVVAELKNRILEHPKMADYGQRKVEVSEYFLTCDSLGESLDEEQTGMLCNADWMIFVFPLYLDSPASNLQAALEDMLEIRDKFKGAKVSCLALAGLYEGEQTETAIEMIKIWTEKMGLEFVKGAGFGGSGSLPGLKKIMPGEGVKKSLLELYDEIILANIEGKPVENSYRSIGMTLEEYKDSCESAFRGLAARNGFSIEDMGKKW